MPSVLYLEDTESMQAMYGFALTQEGFDLTIASNADEALTHLEDHQFDIILVDMMLFGKSGIDFLEEANLAETNPQAKVIVLSNFDSPHIIERAEAFPITAYLIKADYEPRQLALYLKQVLADNNSSNNPPEAAQQIKN